MITRLFDSGTSNGQSPVNYLMSMKDHTGEIRSVAPELIEGDPQQTIDLINLVERKYKYTSGVISFRENEKPTPQQIKNIISDFRKSFLPGLSEDNFNDLWVLHKDKKNTELHFVVVMDELQSGRQLNIHPPGKRNMEHWTTFNKVQNHKNGWDQVMTDPLKAVLSGFDLKTARGEKSKLVKSSMGEHVKNSILSGKIQDRDQLITFLKNKNCQITRVGKDYISVKLPSENKARRFKGEMFSEGANYADLIKQHHLSKTPQRLTIPQYKAIQVKLKVFVEARRDFNVKAYLTPKKSFRRPRKLNIGNEIKKIDNVKQLLKSEGLTHARLFKPATNKPVKNSIANIRKPVKSKSAPRSTGTAIPNTSGSKAILLQQGGLMAQLNALYAQIGLELDPTALEELRAQAFAIKQQLEALGKDYREAISQEISQSVKKI